MARGFHPLEFDSCLAGRDRNSWCADRLSGTMEETVAADKLIAGLKDLDDSNAVPTASYPSLKEFAADETGQYSGSATSAGTT